MRIKVNEVKGKRKPAIISQNSFQYPVTSELSKY